MLSFDLAELYGVEPRVLLQAVKRNIERFPGDFMFQLTWEEVEALRGQLVAKGRSRSQIVTLNKGRLRSQFVILKRGQHVKHLPYAFTEQGIAMLSSVLRSRRAVRVNIEIMRAFVRVRQYIAAHADLAKKLRALERKCDGRFRMIFDAIRALIPPKEPRRPKIGFRVR